MALSLLLVEGIFPTAQAIHLTLPQGSVLSEKPILLKETFSLVEGIIHWSLCPQMPGLLCIKISKSILFRLWRYGEMRKTRLYLLSIIFIIFVLSLMNIFAAGSGSITYQGTIFRPDGKPPKDDSYNMRFSLWNVETNGTEEINRKWIESWENADAIYVKDGCFSVALGSVTPFAQDLFKENPLLWLQIAIDLNQNNIFEPDEIFATRAALTATPYAFQADNATTATFAQNAETLDGLDVSAFSITGHSHYYLDAEDGNPTQVVYVDNDGNVGIGTTTPGAKLEVKGGNIAIKGISDPTLEFKHDTDTVWASIYRNSSDGDFYIKNDQGGDIILDNGKVGIGTTSPSEKLDVNGNANMDSLFLDNGEILSTNAIQCRDLESGGQKIEVSRENIGYTYGADFTGKLVVNGNVGIGTRYPTELLEVAGNFRVGGSSIYVNSDSDKVGIGTTSPTETLDIQGAVRLGDTATTNPGTIRWTGSDFEGYNGSEWVSLTKPSPGSGVPQGAIIMWSGSTSNVPEGWALCDGNNGRPDLQDKFIVGAGNEYNVADTGGEKLHQLTTDEMPSHSHTIDRSTSGAGADRVSTGIAQTSGTTTGSTGENQPHENRPPYYALAYIIKL